MSLEVLQSLITPIFNTDDLSKMVVVHSDLTKVSLGDIQLAPSSQKIGDSYLSNIVRFTINATGINKRGEEESVIINVITKVLPSNLGRRKTFRSIDFFANEVIFYDKVWTSLKGFYKSKNLDLDDVFGEMIPLFLAHHIDQRNDFICLEDLSYKNYNSVERGDGTNYFYTVKVMDLFAKFHSLSLAFKDQKPAQFTEMASSLKETYFSRKYYSWYGKLQESLFELVRDAVKKELPQKYYEKIDNVFKNDFFKKTCDICENNHCHLSGITHGDAWIPNFLFRQDTADHLHVALIDFQLSRWAPFSNDITFFLFACVEENTLVEHWDDFINEYAMSMKKYLAILGSSPDVFNVEEFRKNIKENIVYTIAMVIEALTMSLLDGFDLELIQGNDAVPLESVWVIHPFEDEARRKRVANAIKLIVDRGFI